MTSINRLKIYHYNNIYILDIYLILVNSNSRRYPLFESPNICNSSTTTQPISCSPSSSISLKKKIIIILSRKPFIFNILFYRFIIPLAFSIVAIPIFTDRNPPIGV